MQERVYADIRSGILVLTIKVLTTPSLSLQTELGELKPGLIDSRADRQTTFFNL